MQNCKQLFVITGYKTISQQNKDEEMSSGHFDSEAQRERRTEHFGLLYLLPTKTRIKTSFGV